MIHLASLILGFEPGSDPAFCSILSTVVMDGKRVDADYPILAGNLAWNYLAFVVLPILFISTLCRNRQLEKMETKVKELYHGCSVVAI